MEIKDFLWLMWRGARYLMLGLLLGVGLGLAGSILQPPDYEASTRVLVNRPRQQTNVDLLPLSEDQLVSTNALMVKTKPVLDDASHELGIKINPDNVTVTVLPNTMVMQIKVQDRDPKQAAAIANTLVQILIKENENILEERYAATESALKAQIDLVQKEIDSLQTQYTQMNDASIQEQLKLVAQQIELLEAGNAGLEQDILNFPPTLTVAGSAALAQKQAQLEQQRSLLNLYQQIQVNLTFTGQPGQGGANRDIPSLTNIQSNINLYQQIYLALQNSLEANRSDRTLNTPDVLQIDPAVPPKVPVRPLPALYILLGGLVGFSFAASAILLADHINKPIKSGSQIEQSLGLPVLGAVSELQTSNQLVSLISPASAHAEDFRALAAAIDTARGEGKLATLMVVNAAGGEAKTTVSANLAVAYARQGRQVTLLDGDSHHPFLHPLFHAENQSGLVNLIDETREPADIGTSPEGIPGLTFVPAGSSANHATGWMSAEKWGLLFSRLRKPKGLVIVDSPAPETADAQTLASRADAVLLVVRAGQTSSEALALTFKRFKLVGARVLGIVLYRGLPSRRLGMFAFSWKRIRSPRKEERSAYTGKAEEAQTPS